MPHLRHLRAGVAVALTASSMAAVMLAGCTATPEVRPSSTLTPFPTTHASTPTGTGIGAGATRPRSSDAWTGREMVCPVKPSAAVRTQIERAWSPAGLPRGASLVPHSAPAPDGWMYADIASPAFTGVALVNEATGATRRIRAFEDPKQDQSGGAFDGRYVFFSETHSMNTMDDFSLFSFDARTGKVIHIADASKDKAGNFYTSPWQNPVAHAGLGAWVEGVGPNDRTVNVVDLATGATRVVARGLIGGLQFLGGTLVYVQARADQHGSELRARNPATGAEVPVPPALALAKAGQSLFYASSPGGKVAYIDATLRQLFYAPDATAEPRLILQLPAGAAFQGALDLTDDALMFAQQGKGAQYVDLHTGNTFTAGGAQFYFLGDGKVVSADGAEGVHKGDPMRLHILDVPAGSVTGCLNRPATPELLPAPS